MTDGYVCRFTETEMSFLWDEYKEDPRRREKKMVPFEPQFDFPIEGEE